jgi:HK97 family phage portal protein
MKLIPRMKQLAGGIALSLTQKLNPGALQSVGNRHGYRGAWCRIGEAHPGDWQKNIEWTIDCVLAHPTVYACITLIANDIGKLRQKLVEQDDGSSIWAETSSPAFSPVLKRPNRYQNHIQFKQWWMTSKLIRGNTYALKARDNRGVVTALYILDPCRVTPMVAPDGQIFYQLASDNLTGLRESSVTVPASEIIHDRMNCLFHPLVGISPLFACGKAAWIGLRIQNDSSNFFENGSNPGGILMVPGELPQGKADELKRKWDENYGGDNTGAIAVLADGLKFQQMRMSSVDSQVIEQLKWSDEKICSVYHVPPYKVGVGAAPAYNNIGALQQDYYATCLQVPIEEYETCMDEGLGLEPKVEGRQLGVELDLRGLLRMDRAAQVTTSTAAIKGSLTTINEERADMDLPPLPGGDTLWMQQQNYSVEALIERDENDPFAKPEPVPPPVQQQLPLEPPAEDDEDEASKSAIEWTRKALEAARMELTT